MSMEYIDHAETNYILTKNCKKEYEAKRLTKPVISFVFAKTKQIFTNLNEKIQLVVFLLSCAAFLESVRDLQVF